MKKTFYVLIINIGAIFFLYNSSVSAENFVWVTVEGSASLENFSEEEARKSAIQDAMFTAVDKVVGASISGETLAVNLKLSGGLVGAIPYGSVTEKNIIEEGVVTNYRDGKDKPQKTYKVKMKAEVREETTGADPSFKLDAALNRLNYRDGDEMILSVMPTSDCFIAVFVIMEDDRVLRLLPNSFKEVIVVQSFETFSFPDAADTQRGISLKAHLPKGKNTSTEMLYVLALKRPFHFDAAIQQGIFGLYNGQTAFINNLIKEVVNIPMSERAEKMVQYQISK